MIKVCIFKRAGRKCYEAQWVDPDTGKKKTRSTGTDRKRDAERFAGNLEKELRQGTFREPQRVTWESFRKRFEEEEFPKRREKTQWKYQGTMNLVEEHIKPATLAALNEGAISKFAAKLRELKREEPTVKGHLSNIRSLLRWAHGQRLILEVPRIEMPETTDTTGRAVTQEEFDRILEAVPKVVEVEFVDSWRYLITGLWWSGLRLDEAMKLSWDDDRFIMVDFAGKRPMFQIKARGQKNRKETLTPMAPEFAKFLEAETDRTGYVFNPAMGQGRPRTDTASKVISKIGEKALVKVGEYERSEKTKHAGSHDLRRSFGFRWSIRVLPPRLKELMRHSSIDTTMRYYVGQNAQETADAIWDAFANASANINGIRQASNTSEAPQTASGKQLANLLP